MAIFTPENNRYMKLLKTTLNTNRYFEENKKMYYNDETESATISTTDTSKYTITSGYDNYINDIESVKTFNEQQIKINKQTKNNFDRLNKKITVVGENTLVCINESKQELVDNILQIKTDINSDLYNNKKDITQYIKDNITDIIYYENIKLKKIEKGIDIIVSGLIISIFTNIFLFAYLINNIIK